MPIRPRPTGGGDPVAAPLIFSVATLLAVAAPVAFAVTYAGLGDVDAAFDWLERAYRLRDGYLFWQSGAPGLDPLHADPRFADLVHRVGGLEVALVVCYDLSQSTLGHSEVRNRSEGLTPISGKDNRTMRIAKTDIPEKIHIPGAVARQVTEFGDATGYGKMAGEYFSLGAGTDIAPLLKGLDNDLCQSPHWGYLIEGEITITYGHGSKESVKGGDLFYWPPGHTVAVSQDAEVILFSPQLEHCAVVEHMRKQLAG